MPGDAVARYDLFLAHPSGDKASATALYDLLQADLRVFLDCRTLRGGDRWDREIPAAQRVSRATVVLISARADVAWYVGDEIVTGIEMHRAAPDGHLLVPVLLEPGVPMPYGLRAVQAIDAVAVGGLAGVAAHLRDLLAPRGRQPPALPVVPVRPPGGAIDARALHDRLLLLTDTVFEQIIFHAHVDRGLISARQAPLAARALDVAQLAALDQALCRRLSELVDQRAARTRAQPVPPAPSPRATAAAEAVAAWREWGLRRHGHIRIVGFQNAHQISIELDRVFVPLYVHADRGRKGTGERRDAPDAIGELAGDITLDDALDLATDGRTLLALIGYPGAGKTTLLHHLFRRVATHDVARVPYLRELFPVLVRLASVTEDEQRERGLARVIARAAKEAGYADAAAAVLAPRHPAILFLLDGLDEVRDEATRRRICTWLEAEVDHWPRCAFVVTSRPGAWARTPDLGARFRAVWLQGFGRAAIREYVGLWFAAVERHFRAPKELDDVVDARARDKAAALLAVLASPTWRISARLLEMTTNPLMLSTLCLAHYSDTRLPEQRGELYDRALGLLIEVWTGRREGAPLLRNADTRLVLQPLAYAMHQRDLRELPDAEAADLVRAPLAEVPALRTIAPTAERFLELIRDECGVLASRELGAIEFVHLSFQEYLAAAHVAERGLAGSLAERVADPRWEEVILLAMSMPGVFAPFMTAALAHADLDAHHALLRKCLAEARRLVGAPFEAAADRWLTALREPPSSRSPSPAAALQRLFDLVQGYDLPGLIERARTLVDHGDPALRAAARALTGVVASAAGAPVEGAPFVEPVSGMRFLWIPDGSFVMGSSKTERQPNYDPEAHECELPAHHVTVTGFWMAEHPVTNEQYQRFLAEHGGEAPSAFGDRRLNDPAQPVVTVDWDAARAFAAWLTTKLTGIAARLPTEAEWEYAARGTDGRRYPWGNAPPEASRATFGLPYDTGAPSVVGRTPAGKSPFGVQELAGNVREWCLDAWRDNHGDGQPAVDPCLLGDPRGAPRVVRGGSWNVEPRDLRCAYRNWNRPRYRYVHVGFRVVVSGSRQHVGY